MKAFLEKVRWMYRFWFFVSFCTLCWLIMFFLIVFKLQESFSDKKSLLTAILIASFSPLFLLHLYLILFGNTKFYSWLKFKQALILFRGNAISREEDFIDVYWLRRDTFKICWLQILGIFFIFDIFHKLRIWWRIKEMDKRINPKVEEKKSVEVMEERVEEEKDEEIREEYDNTLVDNISGSEIAVY